MKNRMKCLKWMSVSFLLIGCYTGSVFGQLPLKAVVRIARIGEEAVEKSLTQPVFVRMEKMLFNGVESVVASEPATQKTIWPMDKGATAVGRYWSRFSPDGRNLSNETWLARTRRAGIVPPSSMGEGKALELIQKNVDVKQLPAEELQSFYMQTFPALVLEDRLVPTEKQMRDALSYYKRIITKKFNEKTPLTLENWGEVIAATTYIGWFGKPEDGEFVGYVARMTFPGDVNDWVDLPLARALLSMRAYGELRDLLDYRLHTQPAVSAVWKNIARYADIYGIGLKVPMERVRKYGTMLTMSDEIQRQMGSWNPYNLFHTDVSVEMTEAWVEIGQRIKDMYVRESLREALRPSQWEKFMTQETAQAAAVAMTRFPEVWNSLPVKPVFSPVPSAEEIARDQKRLFDHALRSLDLTWQRYHRLEVKPEGGFQHAATPSDENIIRDGNNDALWEKLYDLQQEARNEDARFQVIKQKIEEGWTADRISWLVNGYPYSHPDLSDFTFTNVEVKDGRLESSGPRLFTAPTPGGHGERIVKQTFLDQSARNYKQAIRELWMTQYEQFQYQSRAFYQSALQRAGEEQHQQAVEAAQKQVTSAYNQYNYVKREVLRGTPVEEIYEAVYAHALKPGEVWELPPLVVGFQSIGDRPAFEAPVQSLADKREKQELLDYATADYLASKKSAAADQRAVDRFIPVTKKMPVDPYKSALWKAERAKNCLADRLSKLQRIEEGIQQGHDTSTIIADVYGYAPLAERTRMRFLGPERSYSWRGGAPLEGEISTKWEYHVKQRMLDKFLNEYEAAQAKHREIEENIARLSKKTGFIGQHKRKKQLESYLEQNREARENLSTCEQNLKILCTALGQGKTLQEIYSILHIDVTYIFEK